MLVQKTLNMASTTGYLITLDSAVGFSKVTVRSTLGCSVRPVKFSRVDAAPVAPTADPAPAAGGQSNYYRMVANEVVTFGYELPLGGNDASVVDAIQYLQVWSESGTGTLVVNAH